jgi:HK97 family phage major capsid protein
MTLTEMQERRTAINAELSAMHDTAANEQRNFTEPEQAEWDALETEDARLEIAIKREERLSARTNELKASAGRKTTPAKVEGGEPAAMKDPKKGFKRLGDFCADLRASAIGAPVSQTFRDWQAACHAFAAGTGGAIAAVDSSGGALIPGGFVNELFEKPVRENAVLSRLQMIPITEGNTVEIPYIDESSRADGSRQGGIRAYRTAELEQMTQSKPSFGKLKLHAEKLTGLAYVSDEMLKFSSVSVDALLSRLFQREFTFKLVDEVINGTGGEEFVGLVGSDCLAEVTKETGQAADTLVWNNISKMWSRRHVASGPFVWLTNQDTFPQLSTMSIPVGTGGVPVWMPANSAAGMPHSTLLGAPVIEVEQCPTLGDKGDIILAALGEYIYAPVPGMDSDVSIHLKFDYNQTAFRFVMYCDGAPWWSSDLTPFKGTATQSPFVVTKARA